MYLICFEYKTSDIFIFDYSFLALVANLNECCLNDSSEKTFKGSFMIFPSFITKNKNTQLKESLSNT